MCVSQQLINAAELNQHISLIHYNPFIPLFLHIGITSAASAIASPASIDSPTYNVDSGLN